MTNQKIAETKISADREQPARAPSVNTALQINEPSYEGRQLQQHLFSGKAKVHTASLIIAKEDTLAPSSEAIPADFMIQHQFGAGTRLPPIPRSLAPGKLKLIILDPTDL